MITMRQFGQNLRLSDGETAHAVVIEFDPAEFHLGLFEAMSIDCPAVIRRSVLSRQAEFFYGRMAAQKSLSALMGTSEQLPIGTHREPVWPAGVVGSISHTNRYAAALAMPLGKVRGVGLDIEHVLPAREMAFLQSMVVDQREINLLQEAFGLDRLNLALTVVFSAKEAFYKAVFRTVQTVLEFSAARVTFINIEEKRVVLKPSDDIAAKLGGADKIEVFFDFIEQSTTVTTCLYAL
jgi:enterobactin synthetase component D